MHESSAAIVCGPPISVVKVDDALVVIDEICAQRLPSFYRIAYRFLGNRADAEDAVQDALLSAYKHLHEFRGQSQLSTWLTSIVCNCARMQLRRRPRYAQVSIEQSTNEDHEHPLSERLVDGGPTPEDECQQAELKVQLRELAGRLSPPLRKTFQLRDLEGKSVLETASILNLSEGTVKAQLSRARAEITKSMRRMFDLQRRRNCGRNSRSEVAGDPVQHQEQHCHCSFKENLL